MNTKPLIITIGGNIGCGKSTMISKLDYLECYQEPIEKWGSWLDLFYTDPKKNAFGFQMKILLEFLYDFGSKKKVLTERSPYDALYIFTKVLKEGGYLSYMEYNLFKDYTEKFGWKPDVYIYLRVSPEICLERITKRSRGCECGVTLEYLQQLHDAHEEYVKVLEKTGTTVHEVNNELEDTNVTLSKINHLINLLNYS